MQQILNDKLNGISLLTAFIFHPGVSSSSTQVVPSINVKHLPKRKRLSLPLASSFVALSCSFDQSSVAFLPDFVQLQQPEIPGERDTTCQDPDLVLLGYFPFLIILL